MRDRRPKIQLIVSGELEESLPPALGRLFPEANFPAAERAHAFTSTRIKGAPEPFAALPSATRLWWMGQWIKQSGIQQRFDHFNYDPWHISFEAGAKARYGAGGVVMLPASETQDTDALEQYLANEYEVILNLNLTGLCPTYDCDNCFLLPPLTPDGTQGCYYDPTVDGAHSLASGGGHAMVLVGFNHNTGQFLVKNSWGTSTLPYLWVPYEYVRERSQGGTVITSVRPATSAATIGEAAFLGVWHAYAGTYPIGKLVLHRTRNTADSIAYPSTTVTERPELKDMARLGTYYDYADGAYSAPFLVRGRLDATNRLELWVGDPIGQSYSGGSYFGYLSLDDMDKAHDATGSTYLKDYSNRARANWKGTWKVIVNSSPQQQLTMVIDTVAELRSTSGSYALSGTCTLGSAAARPCSGTIDDQARHARLSFTAACTPGYACAQRTYTLDASFYRGTNGSAKDWLLSSSTFSTRVGILSTSVGAWGQKQ